MEKLCEMMRDKRRCWAMSLREVALESKIPAPTLQRMEKGAAPFTRRTLKKACRWLGLDAVTTRRYLSESVEEVKAKERKENG